MLDGHFKRYIFFNKIFSPVAEKPPRASTPSRGRSPFIYRRTPASSRSPTTSPSPSRPYDIVSDGPVPRNFRPLEVRRDSVTLLWEPASSSSRYPVKSYIIEKSQIPTSSWTRVAKIPSHTQRHTVTDLSEGSSYRFRILSEYPEGFSTPLEYEEPIYTKKLAGLLLKYFFSLDK